MIATALKLNQRSDDAQLFFAVMVIFGVALLSQQQRLENYGSFARYLPLAYVVDRLRGKWPAKAALIAGLWGATAAAAYVPAYPALVEPLPLGSSQDYETSLHVLQRLRDACATQPGIVLASSDDGHPITFHTRCSVISDDFIITAQHEQKLLETDRLMHSSVDEVLHDAPYVRYIFVRCQIVFSGYANGRVTGTTCVPHDPDNQGLREQLLIDGPPFPPRLK